MQLKNTSILSKDPLLGEVYIRLGRPSGCRVTGGYVRDRLLGRPTNDLDLTMEGTAAAAETAAKRLAKSLGVRAHFIGAEPHRIWRIETPAGKIELWPLGGLTAEEDIRRRDFSCNALSWELPDGPLVDLVGGVDDLGRDRLRAISRYNLESDPVRLLRAPRFLAQLPNFDLDKPTRRWILELGPSLASAPRERVGQELLTLLRGPASSRGLAESLRLGLFEPASPAPDRVDGCWITAHIDAADRLAAPRHAGGTPVPQKPGNQRGVGGTPAEMGLGDFGDAARLAFLIRGWGVPPARDLAAYAWTRTDREAALVAARGLDAALSTVDAPPADRRELAWRTGTAFPTLMALASAVAPKHTGWRRWRRQWARDPGALMNPIPLLTGAEIAEITGIEPGPELGEAVRGLLRAQIRGEVRTRGGAARWFDWPSPNRARR